MAFGTYMSLVLDKSSKRLLKEMAEMYIDDLDDYKWDGDHVTISMDATDEQLAMDGAIGRVRTKAFGANGRVVAVAVDDGGLSDNAKPHITLGMAGGAKGEESNKLKFNQKFPKLVLKGKIKAFKSKRANMDRNHIASELVQAAKSVVAGSRDIDPRASDMPKRVGVWVLNEMRASIKNYDGILEYVARGGYTMLIEPEYKKWTLMEGNSTRDAGRFSSMPGSRAVTKLLASAKKLYLSSENDEWLSREQVAEVCPSCADRMDANGICRIKASVLDTAKREAASKGWQVGLEDYFGRKARPESKDYQRIEDIVDKAVVKTGYDEDVHGNIMPRKLERDAKKFEVTLAERMAKTIKHADKAYRRARAAEDQNFHNIAKVFFERAKYLFMNRYELARNAAKWESMPKGWTDASRKKFWNTLTGDRKHKVTACIKKMKGKFDDPGAFCASLADRVDPGWRSRKK